MKQNEETFDDFLSSYGESVIERAVKLREILFELLPEIQEQIDLPAKMIAYCYGQKYTEMLCTLIPSKKGLKLGFAWGPGLPDPENLLEGNGKISRYVTIKSTKDIDSPALKELIREALKAYHVRMNK